MIDVAIPEDGRVRAKEDEKVFTCDPFMQVRPIFSAECTIGMVRGLTSLKHNGAMALWHYGNKV